MKSYKQSFMEWEYKYITKLMEYTEVNKKDAMKVSKISRMQINRILARHKITTLVSRSIAE